MAQGPIIISDDGGPPLDGGEELRDEPKVMRIGCQGETMSGLTSANGHHTVTNIIRGFSLVNVTVTQDGKSVASVDDASVVQVIGSALTVLTVWGDDGDIEIGNDAKLTEDLYQADDYYRYDSADPYILKVTVDGASVVTPNGKPIRVIMQLTS